MAFHRPTKAEREKRIAATADLLSHGLRRHQIMALIAQKFDCSPRSVERYLRHGQDLLRKELDAGDQEDWKARSVDVYRQLLKSDDERVRLQAQTRLDKIIGTEHQFTPIPQEHTHNHQVSVKIMEEVRKKPELRNRMLGILKDLPGGFDQ